MSLTRSRWLSNAILLGPWLVCLMVGCAETSAVRHSCSADKKIAFYRSRIGGAGTYPIHARLGLAYLEKYRETGKPADYEEALKYLRQSLDYQRNFEALLGMAEALSERHFFKEALPFADEAAVTLPADQQAKGVLFDIHLALGRIGEAQLDLDAMLQAQRGFESLSRLAALREATGDYSGALGAMKEALNTAKPGTPDLAWAEVRMGSLHVALGEAADAREAYGRALAIHPDYFFALDHLAELDAAQGQWTEAGRLFRKLLRDHQKAQYRLALAEVYLRQGNAIKSDRERSLALAELRQAAQQGAQDPFRPLALLCLEDPKTLSEGLHWAERDWEVRQDSLTADTLAWAYQCNGHSTEALSLSGLAMRQGNTSPLLLLHGGLIRCRAGQTEAGSAMLRQALRRPLAFGPSERAVAVLAAQEVARTTR